MTNSGHVLSHGTINSSVKRLSVCSYIWFITHSYLLPVGTQERDNGLEAMKLNDQNFHRSLENAIIFGKPCLLENAGEDLDPALEPILLQQVITSTHTHTFITKRHQASQTSAINLHLFALRHSGNKAALGWSNTSLTMKALSCTSLPNCRTHTTHQRSPPKSH